MRTLLDRGIAVVARLVVRWLYRSVELEHLDRIPAGGPTLLVANHFNGLVDPVLIVAAIRRLPRFMAKATLWKVRVARPFLALAGIIPVHRSVDGATAGNTDAFAQVVQRLQNGETVAIFPEGTTHDEARMADVRTGAARIAALAWADGVTELAVVPVGITYEDKVALRSRVLLRVGEPLDADAIGRPVTVEDHEAVHELTDRIRRSLAEVAPDYDSRMDAGALGRAAEVALRDPRRPRPVPLADRERLARRLAGAPVERRERIIDEVARYQLALDLVGMSDRAITPQPTTRRLLDRLVRTAVPLVLLAPFALAGALINTLPAVIVNLAGRSVAAPVTKGTVRVLAAMLVFPLTWLALAVFDVGSGALYTSVRVVTFPLSPVLDAVIDGRSGFWPSMLVFLACPLFGLATLWVIEHIGDLVRSWSDWRAVYNRRGQLPEVLDRRTALVESVHAVAAIIG